MLKPELKSFERFGTRAISPFYSKGALYFATVCRFDTEALKGAGI